MSTMSYCAVENTKDNMDTILEKAERFDEEQEWYDSLNESEKDSLPHLIDQCKMLIEIADLIDMD